MDVNDQRHLAFSGIVTVTVGITTFIEPTYINIFKLWKTDNPMQSVQAGLTLSVEEAREVCTLIQKFLYKVEEVE